MTFDLGDRGKRVAQAVVSDDPKRPAAYTIGFVLDRLRCESSDQVRAG